MFCGMDISLGPKTNPIVRKKKNTEKHNRCTAWGLNPGFSECQWGAHTYLTTGTPEQRSTIGKFYIATKPSSSTCQ